MRHQIIIAAAALMGAASAHDFSRATYLGNAGVMVARGETKVLFDAFYQDNYGDYASVPAAMRDAMMAGVAPYDGIDAVFVSHIHGDHFLPERMIAFLRAQGGVVLFAPEQARLAMLAAGVADDDPILKRVRAIDMAPEDKARRFKIGAIDIDVVSVLHAGDLKDVQNYSWRVTLDDKTTVIHFGDAGSVVANFERHKEHFAAKKHDAAFPPYWWYMEESGRQILDTHIDAGRTIGVHVPATATGKGDATRADLGGDAFTDPGETREIE